MDLKNVVKIHHIGKGSLNQVVLEEQGRLIKQEDCMPEEQQPMKLSYNMHTFFDPALIQDGNSCIYTGVRSLVDVPPFVHYPTVGNLSGLTPVMAAMIDCVMKPFRRLNISTTEFATLQAVMFFDPDTEGLDSASQRNVYAEQKKMIMALYKHISQNHESSKAEDRYASILLRIPTIRKVAAKKNESLQIIDMFNLFSLNTLVKETALGIRNTSNTPVSTDNSNPKIHTICPPTIFTNQQPLFGSGESKLFSKEDMMLVDRCDVSEAVVNVL
uniref:NR LBD domain-containing protein n=1 Tax=Ditylenchus dipsaci TaxID=166011 RepID=A0A915CV56_9BILA